MNEIRIVFDQDRYKSTPASAEALGVCDIGRTAYGLTDEFGEAWFTLTQGTANQVRLMRGLPGNLVEGLGTTTFSGTVSSLSRNESNLNEAGSDISDAKFLLVSGIPDQPFLIEFYGI